MRSRKLRFSICPQNDIARRGRKTMFRPFFRCAALITLSAVWLHPGFAQVEQGAITGAVVDSTGASIATAKVTATNQATGTVAKTETSADGYYKIPYLAAGKYNVCGEKEGVVGDGLSDG